MSQSIVNLFNPVKQASLRVSNFLYVIVWCAIRFSLHYFPSRLPSRRIKIAIS
jgi:hypothetical protein